MAADTISVIVAIMFFSYTKNFLLFFQVPIIVIPLLFSNC